MIYFITDITYIKIGYTKNDIKKRLKQLQTSNAKKLYLLGWMEGTMEDEKRLHTIFGQYKVRHNGEWFKPDESLLTFINNNNLKENCKVENIDGQIMSFLSIKTT